MALQPLTAISPIDGRYFNQLEHLSEYFSEYALIKYRVKVEIEYFLSLSKLNFYKVDQQLAEKLNAVLGLFSIADAEKIKKTEATTNHDVKAIEYFLKDKLVSFDAEDLKEWIHFGLTSQDINNTAIPLFWKDFIHKEYLPAVENIISALRKKAGEWINVPMLARTHGQPASPTVLGKEMMVFVERLEKQKKLFKLIPFTAKFGGATGNFNAHHVAFPAIDWVEFANEFCNDKLGLTRQQYTTQIEHYDMLAAHFDAIKRINIILLDFCRDMWSYISVDYFKQQIKPGEVGSSAMPHKVNPIDFENAEGNLGIANTLLEHLSAKLPISRLQRDLTDSTVLRNIGVPMAHTILSFLSIQKGINKLLLNQDVINHDLNNNWAVVAEAIQTILRRENYPQPYEALKELTRGNAEINEATIKQFIESLSIKENLKNELMQINPFNYTGMVIY